VAGKIRLPMIDPSGARSGEKPYRSATFATLFALPWCCIIPAVLSLMSFGFAALARLWLVRLAWLFLPISLGLLGRALWLVHWRKHGNRAVRWITWVAAVLVIGLWIYRLAPLMRI